MKESNVAKKWLADLARTANAKDYSSHLNLISKRVQIYGVPGFEVIDYDSWATQCKHEFETGLLKQVVYESLLVRVMTPGRVMFMTTETVEATDNTLHTHPLEVLLEKEPDSRWRVVQERIVTLDEYEHERRKH